MTAQRGDELDEDQHHHDDLEQLRARDLRLALEQLVGLRDEPELGLDALTPLRHAEAPDRGEVDAREIEVADRLDRVVDALGELRELHEAAHHFAHQLRVGAPEDARTRLLHVVVDAR